MENRIIKFRCWDANNNVLLPSVTVYQDADHVGFSDSDAHKWYGDKYEDIEFDGNGDGWLYLLFDFKLMQFTGLRDKNGKEIYEGDLLTHRYYNSPVVVAWNKEIAAFEFGDVSVTDNSLEIIGNIFENPNLLK